jgi:hypothetical protein
VAVVPVIIPARQTMTPLDDKAATVGRSARAEARPRRAAVQLGDLAAAVN